MFGLGPMEIAVLGVIAVVLFGKKLPDVAKSLGKSVVSFKQGMHGLEDGINDMGSVPTVSRSEPTATEAIRPPQRVTATAPKFEDSPPQV
jgi:sec-independent protein translocase protein TatA